MIYTPQNIHHIVPITSETHHTLEKYVALVKKWQRAVNLVSKHTLTDIWHRHVADSLQIYPVLDNTTKTIVDLGSGGGFPAIILAIIAQDANIGRDIHITMVESDTKKSLFLKECVRTFALNATVVHDRIENICDTSFDIAISRALCNLKTLLDFTKGLHISHAVFLKGENTKDEIATAREYHDFNLTTIPSRTHSDAHILHIHFC